MLMKNENVRFVVTDMHGKRLMGYSEEKKAQEWAKAYATKKDKAVILIDRDKNKHTPILPEGY